MKICRFPIVRLQMATCEICGRTFAHRSDFVSDERICRSCPNSATAKRAA